MNTQPIADMLDQAIINLKNLKKTLEFNHIKSEFVSERNREVTLKINNEIVVFEKAEALEQHEYSTTHLMNGYDGEGDLAYTAEAEFENGSDDFLNIENIELCL